MFIVVVYERQLLEHLRDYGKFCSRLDSSSHWGFITAPGEEANGHNLTKSF